MLDTIWAIELPATQKIVLLFLATKAPPNGGEFICPVWKIAESVGLSVRATSNAIKAVEVAGYIERLNQRDEGRRFMSNSYRLGKRFSR